MAKEGVHLLVKRPLAESPQFCDTPASGAFVLPLQP